MSAIREVGCEVEREIKKLKRREMKRHNILKKLHKQYMLIVLKFPGFLGFPEGTKSRAILVPKLGLLRLVRSVYTEILRLCIPALVDIFLSMDEFGTVGVGPRNGDITIEDLGIVEGQVLFITHVYLRDSGLEGWFETGPGLILIDCCICKTTVHRQPNDTPPLIRVDGHFKCICTTCMTKLADDFSREGKLPAKFSCAKCMHSDSKLTLKVDDTHKIKYSIECSTICKPKKKILCQDCGEELPSLRVSCCCKIRACYSCGWRIEVECSPS